MWCLMSPAASGRVDQVYPGVMKNPASLNKQLKLFWIGVGKDDALTGPGDRAFDADAPRNTASRTHSWRQKAVTSGRSGAMT